MASTFHDLGGGWKAEHQVDGIIEQMIITGPARGDHIVLDTCSVATLRKIYRERPGLLIRIGEVFPHVRSLFQEVRTRSRQQPLCR